MPDLEKTSKIEFIDLKAQQRLIRNSIDARISGVLSHGRYIMGPEIAELEEKLAAYTGEKYCISCGSGTDALLMALMAYGVGPGDAIFTTTFTFVATAEVVRLVGATPVFVDIDRCTFNIDTAKLSEAIEQLSVRHPGLKPKGIIPVDLFGQPADYDEIGAIAKAHNLFVLEDAAQSFGATYKGKRTGSLGDIAATSFFPAKPLGCYGDGGAVFCDDPSIAEKLRSIRVHGQGNDKYDNVRTGINGRLDTLQAAILLAKLEVLDDEVIRRDEVAGKYSALLTGKVVVPFVKDDRSSVWAQFSIMSESREKNIKALNAKGIPTAIYYPKPLHLQGAYKDLGYVKGDFPESEYVADRIFSLPMHPYLEDEQIRTITEAVSG